MFKRYCSDFMQRVCLPGPMRLWLIILLQFGLCSVHAQEAKMAIVNVKLYRSPELPPMENATILMKDGKIEDVGPSTSLRVPKGYAVIDGTGKYATAGFWNCHVHFMERKWEGAETQPADTLERKLQEMLLSRGFVYAFDLAQLDFSNLNFLRRRILSGEVKGPTILAVGVPFTSKSPYYIRPAVLPELTTCDEVEAHIESQRSMGANGIKIWSASPTGKRIDYLPDSLIRAAAQQTREKGLTLFSHPSNNEGMLKAIRNGVDVLTHVSPDDRVVWDAATVSEMLKSGVSLIPPLQLYSWASRLEDLPPDNLLIMTSINQLSVFQKAGGVVLFGTDVGYMTDYDPTEEYLMMERAGMNFTQILAALTTNPARQFRLQQQTGTVGRGLDADLVIFQKDPGVDVKNFTAIELVLHKGVIVYKGDQGK
jgi:imidazolonepropionase-like amidohydrolase